MAMLEDINWNQMWKDEFRKKPLRFSDGHSEKAHWDNMASQFRRWMDVDDYPPMLLQHIKLKKEWSVLDVGCGTGAVALPAAKKAAHVTALDISGEMLGILRQDAKKQGISNVTCMCRSWDDVVVGRDIKPHDVVIASRSVGRSDDLRGALEKIDSAALKYVYLTVWGGGERGHAKGVRAVLGKPYRDVPDHVYVFNILHQMGIRPNVQQLECYSRLIYASLDDAVESSKRSLGPISGDEETVVRDYLNRTLLRLEDGTLEVPDNRPVWSLFWWKK